MAETNRLIEFIVIAVYLCFLLGIGFAFKNFNSNISDFFRSGSRGTWWLVGSSAFMAGISAYTFTGASGVAYTAGWSVAIIYIGNTLGFVLAFLFFAPWFRQLRAITGPEVIRMRYGVFTQQFYAGFGVLTSLLGGGLQLWAMAIFTSAVFGFEIWIVIVAVGSVVMFYSTTGGSWAVMATDFVQSLIMIPLTILIAILCLIEVGGFSGFNALVIEKGLGQEFKMINSPGDFGFGQFTMIWVAAMIFNQAILSNTIVSAQRYFSVKDGRDARKAALLAGGMMAFGSVFWFIPPMVARLLYETEVTTMGARLNDASEAAFAAASIMVLPLGMTGLIVVAMFSATMSSVDSGLNRNAAIFLRDIYPALCRAFKIKELGESGQLVLGRVFSLIFGCMIIGIALYFAQLGGRGMFEVMLNLAAMLGVPLSIPMLLGIFVKRVPQWSAMFSAICGLLPSIIAVAIDANWNFQTKVIANLSAGSIAFVLTIPLWKGASQAYRQQVTEFFEKMYRPIDFEKEIGEASDVRQMGIIGAFTTAVGSFMLLLLFLPNPWHGRLSIIAVAASVIAIGGLMIRAGKRGKRKKAEADSLAEKASVSVD